MELLQKYSLVNYHKAHVHETTNCNKKLNQHLRSPFLPSLPGSFCHVEFEASLFTLSPSSRDSSVPLCFLPLEWYHRHIWGCWYFSQQSWFQTDSSSLAFCMMYSAYIVETEWQYAALTHSFPNFESVLCSMFGSNCSLLICSEGYS